MTLTHTRAHTILMKWLYNTVNRQLNQLHFYTITFILMLTHTDAHTLTHLQTRKITQLRFAYAKATNICVRSYFFLHYETSDEQKDIAEGIPQILIARNGGVKTPTEFTWNQMKFNQILGWKLETAIAANNSIFHLTPHEKKAPTHWHNNSQPHSDEPEMYGQVVAWGLSAMSNSQLNEKSKKTKSITLTQWKFSLYWCDTIPLCY